MNLDEPIQRILSRRAFLTRRTTSLGALALGAPAQSIAPPSGVHSSGHPAGALKALHFPPRAKRVIYLLQSGAPSHLDLFDHKPKLRDMTGEELPPSVRMGQRITGM